MRKRKAFVARCNAVKRYLHFFKISEISILFYISFAGIYGILCVSIYGNFIKYCFNYNCVLQYLNKHLLEFKVLNSNTGNAKR